MPLQLKHHQPKHHSPFHEVLCYTHEKSLSSTPLVTARRPSHKQPGWKVVFEKQGELKSSRKTNTQFWNHFNQIDIPAWSVSQKHKFQKRYYFNTIKIILIENQSNHKTMPSIVLDHTPSTTPRIWQSILRKTLCKFMGYPPKVQ